MWIAALGVVAGLAVAEARAASRDLLATSRNGKCVLRYDGTTGARLPDFIPPGSGGLGSALGMTYGPDGNLYVGSSPSLVKRYNGQTGAFINDFASGCGLSGPADLVFRPDGYCYVSSWSTNQVGRYDVTTGVCSVLVPPGSCGLSAATGILFGPGDNLYVGSYNNDRILRYSATTGACLGVFVPSPGGGPVPDGPAYMTAGRDGYLYVAGRNSDNVLRYDLATGEFIDEFVPPGTVVHPHCPRFGSDGDLYVSGGSSNDVWRYDAKTGKVKGPPGNPNAPFASGPEMNDPWAIVFMPHVADFDADGDVDLDDFARFQACVTGPAIPYNPAALPPGCVMPLDANNQIAADADRDGDLDQADFGVFQRCYSGPGKLPDTQCTN